MFPQQENIAPHADPHLDLHDFWCRSHKASMIWRWLIIYSEGLVGSTEYRKSHCIQICRCYGVICAGNNWAAAYNSCKQLGHRKASR